MEADDNSKRRNTEGGGQRRQNKPLIEKRRRARINQCLTQLKSLVLKASQLETPRAGKLEKADILELTVNYVRRLHAKQTLPDADSPMENAATQSQYKAGYERCVKEVLRFLEEQGHVTDDFRSRVSAHCRARLAKSVDNLDVSSSLEEAGSPMSFHSSSSVNGGNPDGGAVEDGEVEGLHCHPVRPKSEVTCGEELDTSGREPARTAGLEERGMEQQSMDTASTAITSSTSTARLPPSGGVSAKVCGSPPPQKQESNTPPTSVSTAQAQPVSQSGGALRLLCGGDVLLLVDPTLLSQHALVPLCRLQTLQPVSQATLNGHVACTQAQTVMTSHVAIAAPSMFGQLGLASSGMAQPVLVPGSALPGLAERGIKHPTQSTPSVAPGAGGGGGTGGSGAGGAPSGTDFFPRGAAPLAFGRTTLASSSPALGLAAPLCPALSSSQSAPPFKAAGNAVLPVTALTSLPVLPYGGPTGTSLSGEVTSPLCSGTSQPVTRSLTLNEGRSMTSQLSTAATAFQTNLSSELASSPSGGLASYPGDGKVLSELPGYMGLSMSAFPAFHTGVLPHHPLSPLPPCVPSTSSPGTPSKDVGVVGAHASDSGLGKSQETIHLSTSPSASGASQEGPMWQPWM